MCISFYIYIYINKYINIQSSDLEHQDAESVISRVVFKQILKHIQIASSVKINMQDWFVRGLGTFSKPCKFAEYRLLECHICSVVYGDAIPVL